MKNQVGPISTFHRKIDVISWGPTFITLVRKIFANKAKEGTTSYQISISSCVRAILDMGQLISLPAVTEAADVEYFSFDRCPRTLSECIVNRKLDPRRYLECKKRSYEEVREQMADLLFSRRETDDEENAELLREEDLHLLQRRMKNQQPKKRRKQKEVVMFTDQASGMRCRLLPKMSIWYDHCCFTMQCYYCALIVFSLKPTGTICTWTLLIWRIRDFTSFCVAVFVCLTSAFKN